VLKYRAKKERSAAVVIATAPARSAAPGAPTEPVPTAEVTLRVGTEAPVKRPLPIGETVANIAASLQLPRDLDLVVVDRAYDRARPIHSCRSRIREGLRLHFTKKVPIDVRIPNHGVEHFDLPVYGMLLGMLPIVVSELTNIPLTDTILVDNREATADQMRTATVTGEHRIECLDP
jgi:hypothetical protein